MVTKPAMKHIPTSHYYGRNGYDPLQIVIHTMECPCEPNRAEWCAHYFQGSVQASAHYCIDPGEIVQCVSLSKGAWACPYFNHSGIQIEHAGYADSTDWDSTNARRMLTRSAQLSAWLCQKFDIPVRRLTLDQVRKGTVKGFLGHWDATRAGVGGNTHHDPGADFPWDWYLDMVRGYLAGGGGGSHAPVEPDPPKHHKPKHRGLEVDGSLGTATITALEKACGTTQDGHLSEPSQCVAHLQKWMNKHGHRDKHGHRLEVDGLGIQSNWNRDYGPTHTIEALQGFLGTTVDGYLSKGDSMCVRALQKYLNAGKDFK